MLHCQILYRFCLLYLYILNFKYCETYRKVEIRSKDSCISFILDLQLLTFYHISLTVLFTYYYYYYFLNLLRVSCTHDVPKPLNPSVCIENADIFIAV